MLSASDKRDVTYTDDLGEQKHFTVFYRYFLNSPYLIYGGYQNRNITVAVIQDVNTRDTYYGYAICNPKDDFNRADGRRLSVVNALDQIVLMTYDELDKFKYSLQEYEASH